MAINERLIDTEVAAAGNGGAGTGNQEEGLILHLDANDVDSYDGDGNEWVDITNHEYTPTTDVSEHFNTVVYTGDSTATNSITGVGFQPDLVWIKNRTKTGGHWLTDSVRGAGKGIMTQSTSAELTTLPELMSSFNSDGFTVGYSSNDTTNISTSNYVAWCWKAGGAAVSNTDGTITSQVSANNDLGFSIVKWSGDGSAATIGHGLDIAPEIVIRKNSGSISSWAFDTSSIDGSWDYLFLDTTAAKANHSSTSPPSSTTFNTSGSTYNGSSMIAYCFASKRGVSKVGSYTGTGAAGNKVYTGFEPAFVMVKRTDASQSWGIYDNKRVGTSETPQLLANVDNAEAEEGLYFERDGFRLDGSETIFNGSGGTYIYYAVAKSTNETDLIDDTDLELHLDADSFDGSTNTPSTWSDSSGNSRNGSVGGGATFDGELGNWLELDGSDADEITVSHNAALDITSSGFTVEAWVNPDDTNYNTLVAKFSTSASIDGYSLAFNSGDIYWRLYTSGSGVGTCNYTTGSEATANTWHHIVGTVTGTATGSTMKLYKNGELLTTSTTTGTYTPTTRDVRIGGYDYAGSRNFDGKIGQVRFYSSALTQDQVRQNFNFTKNDYPNGYNFTKSGDVSWNSNGYFDFDGNNDRFNAISFKGRPIQSWALWINPDSVSTRYTILTTYPTGTIGKGGMYIELRDDAKIEAGLRTESGSTSSVNSTTTLSANQWQHIVVTSDGTDLTIYINSVERGSTSASVTTFQDSLIAPLGIGYEIRNVRNYFNGQMSDIKVYDKALTQGEIDAQFAIKQTDIG